MVEKEELVRACKLLTKVTKKNDIPLETKIFQELFPELQHNFSKWKWGYSGAFFEIERNLQCIYDFFDDPEGFQEGLDLLASAPKVDGWIATYFDLADK